MRVLVVGVVVDAKDERDVRVGRRRRDEDLLRPCLEVLLGPLPRREQAGRLDDEVDSHVAPRERGRVALGKHLEARVADADPVAIVGDAVETTVGGVVAEQVREDIGGREVVDDDDLEVALARDVRPHEIAADPAEAIDPDPDLRHRLDPLCRCLFEVASRV